MVVTATLLEDEAVVAGVDFDHAACGAAWIDEKAVAAGGTSSRGRESGPRIRERTAVEVAFLIVRFVRYDEFAPPAVTCLRLVDEVNGVSGRCGLDKPAVVRFLVDKGESEGLSGHWVAFTGFRIVVPPSGG